MDQAKEFDDKDWGAYPADRIFAVFDEHNRARKTVSLLNEEDFRPAEVGLLSGLADARKLDAASGETGLFAKLPIFGVDMGDRDSDTSKNTAKCCLTVSLFSQLLPRASTCGTTSGTHSNRKGHISLSCLADLPSKFWKARLSMRRSALGARFNAAGVGGSLLSSANNFA
jgi:hypothetical protein